MHPFVTGYDFFDADTLCHALISVDLEHVSFVHRVSRGRNLYEI